MSTRGVYTFGKSEDMFHVYKHYDNYPEGAAEFILAALDKAWTLPRFEPDEFGAAFIAANKKGGGDIRLMLSGPIEEVSPADIAYHYQIWPAPNGQLIVKANRVDAWDGYKVVETVFYGRVKDFIASMTREEMAA